MSTIPSRASRTQEHDLEEDDAYHTQRPRTSAVRYTNPRQQVIQRGNKRIVIHNEPPPRRNIHWSLILGLGMLTMLVLWAGSAALLNWWNNHQLDTTYGMPRTYQVDEVVGDGDSAKHPTHFIFLNLNGRVEIIEIPPDASHSRIYSGPSLFSDNANQTPVTADFEDVNGDGKIDMIVHIGDQNIVYLNDGTQFKPQQ